MTINNYKTPEEEMKERARTSAFGIAEWLAKYDDVGGMTKYYRFVGKLLAEMIAKENNLKNLKGGLDK